MNQKSLFIIPECYIDTALVEYVLDMRVNHQHSCNNVVRTMKERYGDGFAVGIIDNDKHGMGYLGECSLVAKSNHLEVFKHQNRNHFITNYHFIIYFLADSFIFNTIKLILFTF